MDSLAKVIEFPRRPTPETETRSEPDRTAPPLMREAVGRVLRHRRHAQRRTLRDVADEAAMSTQYLSEVERGRKEVSSELLVTISEALGMRMVDLSRLVHTEFQRSAGSSYDANLLAA